MDVKKKLALAMGAFVSMPVASVATECTSSLTSHRRLRRRRVSVPARIVPRMDQSIRVNVGLPLNKARRVPAACNSYRVEASLVDAVNGGEFIKIDDQYLKLGDTVPAGGGATFEFSVLGVEEPTTVSARVEVTPVGNEACATISPVTSFVLKDYNGQRTFLPSEKLDPVQLRPAELGGPIIIKGPPIVTK